MKCVLRVDVVVGNMKVILLFIIFCMKRMQDVDNVHMYICIVCFAFFFLDNQSNTLTP
jgi:hypothetical protein